MSRSRALPGRNSAHESPLSPGPGFWRCDRGWHIANQGHGPQKNAQFSRLFGMGLQNRFDIEAAIQLGDAVVEKLL